MKGFIFIVNLFAFIVSLIAFTQKGNLGGVLVITFIILVIFIMLFFMGMAENANKEAERQNRINEEKQIEQERKAQYAAIGADIGEMSAFDNVEAILKYYTSTKNGLTQFGLKTDRYSQDRLRADLCFGDLPPEHVGELLCLALMKASAVSNITKYYYYDGVLKEGVGYDSIPDIHKNLIKASANIFNQLTLIENAMLYKLAHKFGRVVFFKKEADLGPVSHNKSLAFAKFEFFLEGDNSKSQFLEFVDFFMEEKKGGGSDQFIDALSQYIGSDEDEYEEEKKISLR